MNPAMLIILNDEDEENENENKNVIVQVTRRRLRDVSNPLDISESQFRKLYRFSKDAARQVINELRPFMQVKRRITAVPYELQIFASISFMASGSCQRHIGQDFLTCMSQSTISKYLHEVVVALNRVTKSWIRFSITEERVHIINAEYYVNTQFPGVIGAIDGTHIAIFPPNDEREHLFIHRKLYRSLNVLIVPNYNYEILAINASHEGQTHDAIVFCSSRLSRYLQDRYETGEKGSWLVGDSAYPLLPYLLTPQSCINMKVLQVKDTLSIVYRQGHPLKDALVY